ncbi:MAG: 2-keto-4-pentenoate hydratase [Kiloniellales bacterium]
MTNDDSEIAEAARQLAEAQETGVPCAPVRDLLQPDDLEAAYRVQERLTEESLGKGRRLVGRKIGLTSAAVQAQLGVDQPDYGMLFADMDAPQGLPIPMSCVTQPRIEAEIAFIMKDALDDARLTSADVLGAIDYAVASLEIVGSRIKDWDIRIVDTVADNASSGLFVLGDCPRALGQLDLRGCRMSMVKQSAGGRKEIASSGQGSACLGSPLTSTLWLAKVMAKSGRPLGKGDVVLSGALGPMVAVTPGDRFEATIEGLGSVTADFAEEI